MVDRPHIWLIGGTSESRAIAHHLSEQSLPYIVTVTTESARQLYPTDAYVQVAPLNEATIERLVQQWQIKCILDASHPFACEISRQAMDCARKGAIAYLRYERTRPQSHPQPQDSSAKDANVVTVGSIKTLITSDILKHQRVLFCLGYRHLHQFSSLRSTAQLFARILPSVEAMEGAIAAGFSPSELIALRPPVSPALEAALWQQWKITRVVAKASGSAGGELTKRQTAKALGPDVKLVLLQRPPMTYLAQTHQLSDMISFAAKTLKCL